MEHNHHQVYVRSVILWTDHKLLASILWKPLASLFKRLHCLLLLLQQYDCEICYKPGKEMLLADTLSRAYLEDYERSATESEVECIHATHFLLVPDHQHKQIQRETACDPTLQFVKKAILDGFPDIKDEQPAAIHQYRISSNNSRGRLFLFSRLIEGRWELKGGNYTNVFQILPTGSRSLKILCYFAIKSKNNHIK